MRDTYLEYGCKNTRLESKTGYVFLLNGKTCI
jgi:hypothetical protein